MSDILWIINSLPEDERHGGYLRFINLARSVARRRRCYLAILDISKGSFQDDADRTIFDKIFRFDKLPATQRFSQHFRLSNIHFLRRSHPEYLESVCAQLSMLVEKHEIRTVIGITIRTAEIVSCIPCTTKIVDDYDCATLTLERHFQSGRYSPNLKRRLTEYIQYLRIKAVERSLTSRFALVTTISRADQKRLVELSTCRRSAIQIVKNGVDPDLLQVDSYGQNIPRSIIFWGNLSFPPNFHAIDFFYRKVFKPYLHEKKIKWYIVGPNAASNIIELGKQNPNIEVTGFVDDLAALVTQIPVMINPMISGSGLKNKMLEAFALRRAVVSTTMGAEAIEASPGIHYVQADSANEMADRILELLEDHELTEKIGNAARQFAAEHYDWDAVGDHLLLLIAEAENTSFDAN